MKIAFYGSSLLSSYWNGAATYYRGLLQALAANGHAITFYEPEAFDRQSHRDIEPPGWANVVVYPATEQAARDVIAQSAMADVAIKASGVGVFDDLLLSGVTQFTRPDALRIFWDVDAPATLEELNAGRASTLHQSLPLLDLVLTYGGGQPVVDAYTRQGASCCIPIYNGLDPATHYPASPQAALVSDLSFLGNRLPDREARVEQFFLAPAAALSTKRFLLGGSGWQGKAMAPNVIQLGHVPTALHNALNCSAKAVLNISRESMASTGFSPATRVFEAAGAGACLITDDWAGIAFFFEPGSEILVARDGHDVVDIMRGLTPGRAREIGEAARHRCLADHSYVQRAAEVDRILRTALAQRRSAAA